MSDQPAPPPRRTSRLQIIVASVIVALLAAWVGLTVWNAERTGVKFAAMFTSSVGVYGGSDVRIRGVPVGHVDSVTPQGTLVRVSMHLNPGISAPADTEAVIVSPNLVADRYVQLTDTSSSPEYLSDGSTIPASRTATPVELDELYRSLLQFSNALGPDGANSDGALSRLLQTGANNLSGNGTEINQTIKQLSAASNTLADSKDQIFGTISNLAQFTKQLQANNSAVITVNNELASVSQTLADDRQSFAEALQELGSALTAVQTFVRNNKAALSQNVAALSKVADTLVTERASVSQALGSAPVLVQNFINAYDPDTNLLRGRTNLNELSVWAQQHPQPTPPAPTLGPVVIPKVPATSSPPPTMLPSAGG